MANASFPMLCWMQCKFKTAYDWAPLYWSKRHQFLLNDVFLNLGPNSNPEPLQIEAVSRFLFRHLWRSNLHLKLAWVTQGGEDYMILLGSNLPNSCINSMPLFSRLELPCLCDPWIKSRLTTAVKLRVSKECYKCGEFNTELDMQNMEW